MQNSLKRSIATAAALAFAVTFSLAQVAPAPPRYDLLLKGGHVIDPANHIDDVRDIAISQGKIAAAEKNIPVEQAGKVVDVSKLYVTPGLIDIHYHVGHGGGESVVFHRVSFFHDLSNELFQQCRRIRKSIRHIRLFLIKPPTNQRFARYI